MSNFYYQLEDDNKQAAILAASEELKSKIKDLNKAHALEIQKINESS